LRGLFDDGEDVVGVQDFVFLAIELDFGAAVLADEDAVADFDSKATFLPLSSVLPVPSATMILSVGFPWRNRE